jgi:hypothetical protein
MPLLALLLPRNFQIFCTCPHASVRDPVAESNSGVLGTKGRRNPTGAWEACSLVGAWRVRGFGGP